MGRTNGKSEVEPRELDLEHELPPADEAEAEAGAPEHAAAPPAEEAASLRQELEKVKAELDHVLDRFARQQAEFDNARKRAAREQQEFREYALAEAVKILLPVLDSFDRAINSPDGGDFRSGVELINKQLHDALGKLGVQPIEAKGQPFDPRQHEAVQMIDTDEAEDNHVVQELQRGYKLKDRLLRPAMVLVAHNPKK
jgi:molecular chaperone GrpE